MRDKKFVGEKEKKNNKTNKVNDKHKDADSLTQYKKLYPMFVQSFKILGAIVPEKSLTKNIYVLEKKKNGQIKAMISKRMLLLSYTI